MEARNAAASPRQSDPPSLEEIREAVRSVIREELHSRGPEAEAPYDSEQAATRLNISRRKLDELVAAGTLRPIRIGRKRLFPREQLDAFLRQAARRRRRR